MATSGNDKYAITSAQGVVERLSEILTDINLRLVQAESRYDATDRAAQEVANQGLRYLETVIVPAATKVADLLLSLSDLFETTSKSSVNVSDPLVTFQVDPKDSNTFATLGYVIASAAGSTSGLGGPVVSFDPKSGVLVIDPDYTWGSGTFSDWKLIGSPPVGAIVAATDPVLASRAQAIGNTIVADATTRIAAAQALVQAVANSRVPLDGSQSMTSALTVGTGNNGRIRVVQGDSTHTGYIDFRQKDDARVAYIGYSASGSIDYWANVPHYFFGSVQTQDMGDLKTYVDKGVRTDVAQPISRTAMRQARKNIGAGPLYSNQFSTNATLDASYLNSTIWLSGSDYTITLPAAGVAVSGDSLEFVNYGTGTITLACQAGTGLYYNGAASVGNITIGPGQTACMTTDGTSWIVGSRALPPERSINPDAANNFTDAQKQQLYANADIAIPVGQCRLNYISPTSIRLDPFNGNKIFINGNYRTIPAAGVSLSNAGLSANTLYYIYATPTLNIIASLNAPKRDPFYGHQVANSGANDATNRLYTLVGAVVTDGSKEFVDSSQFRFVASHFNRSRKHIDLQVSQGGASGSTVMANLGNEAYVFCWGDEAVEFTGVGSCSNGGNQQTMSLQCYLDGLVCGQDATAHNSSPGTFVALTCAASKQPSIGLHRLSIYGKCSGGTSTYYVCMSGTVVL